MNEIREVVLHEIRNEGMAEWLFELDNGERTGVLKNKATVMELEKQILRMVLDDVSLPKDSPIRVKIDQALGRRNITNFLADYDAILKFERTDQATIRVVTELSHANTAMNDRLKTLSMVAGNDPSVYGDILTIGL